MLMGEELYNYAVDMLAQRNMIHDKELIHANEVCEEVFFESVEVDSSSDEYEPKEKKRDIKYIPLDYKIKAVNMAKRNILLGVLKRYTVGHVVAYRLKKKSIYPNGKKIS
ncbi:HTH CENPB-type domain-containing protein [Trichonephila inaurata madagascariensis]|uniref:HTH CENPB-type domain-containing protein n=1 Tax=Trichonephila inaurata madagascariensis TaxID=2747483 RepID=A0A8X7CRL1_9ARAC|nr:HTH CENPB-type domain-containing protein [Trichonephila inaurata madagascariensis]